MVRRANRARVTKKVRNVFSNRTRLALVNKNLPIDIALQSGARGRSHTFLKYHLIIVG